jgi:hypothetical protein
LDPLRDVHPGQPAGYHPCLRSESGRAGDHPLIWRPLRIRRDTPLATRSATLQIVWAWSDPHPHLFHLHGKKDGTRRLGGPRIDVMRTTCRSPCCASSGEPFIYSRSPEGRGRVSSRRWCRRAPRRSSDRLCCRSMTRSPPTRQALPPHDVAGVGQAHDVENQRRKVDPQYPKILCYRTRLLWSNDLIWR